MTELTTDCYHVDQLNEQIGHLEAQLEAEKNNRAVDRAWFIDDYEKLRTTIYCMLRNDVRLLADGRHALNNDSLPVADEFMSRAIDHMEAQVSKLQFLGESQREGGEPLDAADELRKHRAKNNAAADNATNPVANALFRGHALAFNTAVMIVDHPAEYMAHRS